MKRYTTVLAFFMIAFLTVNAQKVKNNSNIENISNKVVYLSTEDFKKLIWNYPLSPKQWQYEGDKPCVIDFFTTWCGPCRRLSPIMEKIAEKYDGLIYVYRVDAEKEVELSRIFNVQSYPTLLFCNNNKIPRKSIGLLPQEQIEQLISQLLLKDE